LDAPVTDAADPQKLGSAVSYGRRYAYCGMIGVQPENEDDDGQAARQAPRAGRGGPTRPAPAPRGGTTSDEAYGSPVAPQAVGGGVDGEALITTTNGDGTPGGQKKRLLDLVAEHKVDKKALGAHLRQRYGISTWAEIKQKDYDAIEALVQAWPHPASQAAGREPGAEG
jgi:hypothetical protein